MQKRYNFPKLKIVTTLLSVIIALLLFKGLFLLISVLNTLFFGLSDSKGELAFSYISTIFLLLPGEVLLVFLIVFLAFRLSMKEKLDWYQILGFILSVIVILCFADFFFGRSGTFSVAGNLIAGYILIGAGMLGLKKGLNN